MGLFGENGPTEEFSGGMKRRVSLLRALLAEYDILFLDEPFKGLDMNTRHMVINAVREMTQGKTVVLITHDPEEAGLLDCKKTIRLT